MKTLTTNNYQSNYELINSMNSTLNVNLTIDGKKSTPLFNSEEISNTTNSFYHEIEQKEYTMLFNGYWSTKEEFIANNYINITKGFIKSLANKCDVGFCIEIVKGHYNDTFFEDLTQIIALTLLENMDRITMLDSNTWSIDDTLKIDCLRAINKYGYANKTRVSNTEIAIIDYDEENKNDLSLAVNTKAYQEYCLSQYDNLSLKSINAFWDIINNVKLYIGFTQKNKVFAICDKVLDLLIQGYKKKDISTMLDISSTTITKYHNIIKNAFYLCYKKPSVFHEKINKYSVKHDIITIDFSGLNGAIANNEISTTIDRVNAYYHDKKQAFYNKLFGLNTNNSCIDNFDIIVEKYYNKKRQQEHEKNEEYYNILFNEYFGSTPQNGDNVCYFVNKYHHNKKATLYNKLFGLGYRKNK